MEILFTTILTPPPQEDTAEFVDAQEEAQKEVGT